MAYLGQKPERVTIPRVVVLGDGTTTQIPLPSPPDSAAEVDVVIGGVTQLGNAFSVSGDYVQLSDPIPNGQRCEIHYRATSHSVTTAENTSLLAGRTLEEILGMAHPLGCILAFPVSAPPAGWLECNGASISRTVYPELVELLNPGGDTAYLPDYRGEFLRGWDHGRGVDDGRVLGSGQEDEFRSHYHSVPRAKAGSINHDVVQWVDEYLGDGTGVGSGSTGGTETRPRNVAVMFCIKAAHVNIVEAGTVSALGLSGQVNDHEARVSSVEGLTSVGNCKAWVNFDGTGTVTIRDSGNVSSVTDLGVGRYQVNFSEEMLSSNYSAVITGEEVSSVPPVMSTQGRGAGYLQIRIESHLASAFMDCPIVSALITC